MAKDYTEITIAGKRVGLKFAYLATKLFIEASMNKQDVYFSEMVDEATGKTYSIYTYFGIAKLAQSGYLNNCEIKEVKPEYTFEDFYNWAEQSNDNEEGQKVMLEVINTYSTSTYTKKLVEAMDEEKKSLSQ